MSYTITLIRFTEEPLIDSYAYEEDFEYDIKCYCESGLYKVHRWENHAIVVELVNCKEYCMGIELVKVQGVK